MARGIKKWPFRLSIFREVYPIYNTGRDDFYPPGAIAPITDWPHYGDHGVTPLPEPGSWGVGRKKAGRVRDIAEARGGLNKETLLPDEAILAAAFPRKAEELGQGVVADLFTLWKIYFRVENPALIG